MAKPPHTATRTISSASVAPMSVISVPMRSRVEIQVIEGVRRGFRPRNEPFRGASESRPRGMVARADGAFNSESGPSHPGLRRSGGRGRRLLRGVLGVDHPGDLPRVIARQAVMRADDQFADQPADHHVNGPHREHDGGEKR